MAFSRGQTGYVMAVHGEQQWSATWSKLGDVGGLTEDNEFGGEPGGCAAGRQLIAAVDAGVFQRRATDAQPTPSTGAVTGDVMPRREPRDKFEASVDDLRLVAERRVEEPTERRMLGVGTTLTSWLTAEWDVWSDHDGGIDRLFRPRCCCLIQ